ncbi:proteoglycan 4-like isoform X2 [Coturnix japonica]|uniref:proteoglycan 4-like isoform X2 n=1 Tax=Coturnix japonica TaxID=93934 RepID=UPI0013A5C4FA|nr:proteoglycan 4-like isoform X2 [Coturnix japonica]
MAGPEHLWPGHRSSCPGAFSGHQPTPRTALCPEAESSRTQLSRAVCAQEQPPHGGFARDAGGNAATCNPGLLLPTQVGRRPQQAVLPGRQSQDLSVRGIQLPPLPHPAQASGSRRAQADRPELRQGLPRSSGSGEGRRPLPALPPLPQGALSLPAAPQNAATARGQVHTLSTLPPIASRSFPRGRAASAVRATTSRVAVPGLQDNPQPQETAVRAEGWQADLSVPALPLRPAEKTPESLRLAYRMRPAAIRSGPWLKPAQPRQRAPTSTVRTPARRTQVLAPKAGKVTENETQRAASAQEDSGDAHRVSTSRSLAAEQAAEKEAEQAAEQAADNGAKDAEDSKERARSARRGDRFLPCSLCCSTYSAVGKDEQDEGKDTSGRDAMSVAGKEPVSTSFPGAEALPPASSVPGNLQHDEDSLEIRDTFTHSSTPGEGRQPLPTCGPSLCVPAPPLKPAHATRKSYNLTYRRRPVATRPRPCRKPASPRQSAPTSTEETAAQATQLLAPQVGSSPTHQTPPAPSAQEGSKDAVKAPESHSQEAEQAAEGGARAAGTPQDMLVEKDDEERACSSKRGGMFLPFFLCCSTSTSTSSLMDEVEDEEESVDIPIWEGSHSYSSTHLDDQENIEDNRQ